MWKKEGGKNPEVAELIIEGNHIEFYSRDYEVFPCTYIGSDGEHSYKVFTNGCGDNGQNRSLKIATSYKVRFVLLQNYGYEAGTDVTGITECSFIIPEIIEWIDQKMVDWGATEEDEVIAAEMNRPEIILKKENPYVEIYCESGSILDSMKIDTRTTFVIKNQPRIRIKYATPVDVNQVFMDIKGLMQFWGLMIGHITDALDIRLTREGHESKSWLYLNADFSYNLRTSPTIDKSRTKLSVIGDNIQGYFENWYEFYYDNRFELVRRMYFMGNARKDILAEDILVQYVRILEGYYIRVYDEEVKTEAVHKAIRQVEKEIKKLIFTDDGKALFTKAFEEAVPDWKFNTSHALDVSKWIASGYLERKGLSEKIKELDVQHFEIIAKNAKDIIRMGITSEKKAEFEKEDEKRIVQQFYQNIVSTRNYYSHYKEDTRGVLNFTQMCHTINVLKALIIMIFYSHMNMDNETIRKIIMWDAELHFETMCLRKDGEKPDDMFGEENTEVGCSE